MSVVEAARDKLEERVQAIAGGVEEDGYAVLTDATPGEIGRKMLYGFVDNPEQVAELIEAAKNASMSTRDAMLLSGPRGAMGAMMLAFLQTLLLGILIGKEID